MDTSKLKPNDPRVKHESAVVRGKTYSYILGVPQGPIRDTVFLIHGFPDFSFGWRYQIPFLMSLGFRVVAPNMLGYPGTDSPEDVSLYSLKSMSEDVRELARLFVGDHGKIILGGHDWGSALVWRIGYWFPELIKGIFTACLPPWPPTTEYIDLESLIKQGKMLNFKYQLQLMSTGPQEYFQGKDRLRQFFRMMNMTGCSDGSRPFTVDHGVHYDRLDKLAGPCRNLTADEVDYYVECFSQNKQPELRGGLNWYRNRQYTFDEELERAKSGYPFRYQMPALYFCASGDAAVPPSMSVGMERFFANLTQYELNTSHWIMSEAPDEFNRRLGEWLDTKVYSGKLKAML